MSTSGARSGCQPEEAHPDTWGRIHESRDLVDALGQISHCSLNPPSTAKPF
jgi:hypothetical protein